MDKNSCLDQEIKELENKLKQLKEDFRNNNCDYPYFTYNEKRIRGKIKLLKNKKVEYI